MSLIPFSRRSLLQRSALGLGALALGDLLVEQGALADAGTSDDPMAVRPPHFPARARRVVHFFLNGGPSHVDTFDPKPALSKYDGRSVSQNPTTERKTGAAFPSPFQFKGYGESGIEVSELFERTARHIDDIAVIRSMYAQVPNHEPSLMLMNCGDSVLPRPSVGAWVTYGLGSENRDLPGFIAMCPGGLPIKDAENWQSAFLPGVYQGTFIDPRHTELDRLIENIRSPHASRADPAPTARPAERPQRRASIRPAGRAARGEDPVVRDGVSDADRGGRGVRHLAGAEVRPRALRRRRPRPPDPDRAPPAGAGRALRPTLARRRAAVGQPRADRAEPPAAGRRAGSPDRRALTDLKRLGMLEETLVIWGGEFGRTPTVELNGDGKSQLGRDHNHYGFTVWMAGGGIKGGTVHGATDELGFKAVEDPVSVHDLHATILHLLGLDHERLTYRYAGRDFRLTDVAGKVVKDIVA